MRAASSCSTAPQRQLARAFDSHARRLRPAPKFPHRMDLQLLLAAVAAPAQRQKRCDMVTLTLDKMAAGGIYDHLGGGFARYTVDERWLVPHFEKMLYDNALLTGAYLDALSGHAATTVTPASPARRATTSSRT